MSLNSEDWEFVALVNREVEHYSILLEDAREREAISAVFNISRLGNQLMQHNTPWKLVKVDSTSVLILIKAIYYLFEVCPLSYTLNNVSAETAGLIYTYIHCLKGI